MREARILASIAKPHVTHEPNSNTINPHCHCIDALAGRALGR